MFNLRDSFDAQKVKEVVWAIFDNLRCFFDQRLQPADFCKHTVAFPTSLLDCLYEPVCFADNVRQVNFPVQWMENKDRYQPKEQSGSSYRPGAGNRLGRAPFGADRDSREEQELYRQPTGDNYDHMHPKFSRSIWP